MRLATRILRSRGGGTSGGGGGFDPTTSDPTGFWRANFASPWTPTASAGTSGSNGNLANSLGTSGTAVNGYTPVTLNGTSAFLSLASAVVTSLVSATAGTYLILGKLASTPAAAAANFYDDTGLMVPSSGNAGLVINASGVVMGTYDTASRQTSPLAVANGAWFLAAGRIDSGNVKCRVSSGGTTTDATPVAIPGSPLTLGADLFTGKNYAAAKFAAIDVLEVVTYSYAVADSVLANWKNYFNSRYLLSL